MAKHFYADPKWPYEQISEKVITLHYENGLDFSVYYPYDLYSALRIGNKVYGDPLFLRCMEKMPEEEVGKHKYNLWVAGE